MSRTSAKTTAYDGLYMDNDNVKFGIRHHRTSRHHVHMCVYVGAVHERERATWFAKPIPTPSKTRASISMNTLYAAPPIAEPARNEAPARRMDDLRPKALVTGEAQSEATRPAM